MEDWVPSAGLRHRTTLDAVAMAVPESYIAAGQKRSLCNWQEHRKNAFGDLFLRDPSGQVFRLQVDIGKLTEVADSQERDEWFSANDEQVASLKGLKPNAEQCIAFSIPIVIAERGRPNPPYVANIYEHLSFLGDLNRQISNLPDGAKIQLRIEPKP